MGKRVKILGPKPDSFVCETKTKLIPIYLLESELEVLHKSKRTTLGKKL
jgi:hypothetical protein